MGRPTLMRILPDVLKPRAFYRFYFPVPSKYAAACQNAPLSYANGMSMTGLMPSDVIGGSIAMMGFYERKLSRRIAELARNGGRMIDVGANIGYFSLIWLAGNSRNTVVAIEASPRNVKTLRANMAHNHIDGRVEIHGKAAGEAPGTLAFDPGPEEQTGWGGLQSHASSGSISVETVRVDSLVTDDQPIEVMKVDIEGADTWAILGAEALLRKRQIRHVFFEQNAARLAALGIDENAATALLKSHGYQLELLDDEQQNKEWHAYC